MFSFTQKILFKHCDPAGIVFYPRYFEMLNDVVEAFFDEMLDFSFSQVLEKNGVPTAQINTTFSAPSRLGEQLKIDLSVTRLGGSSLHVNFEARCEDELRFSAASVLVFVDQDGRPTPWPDSLRNKIQSQLQGDN